MTPQTEDEGLAARIGSHVELLQNFFTDRGVPFGSEEDASGFAERLAAGGSFREDTASLLRTILYRENLTVTRPELLEILVFAVTGRSRAVAEQATPALLHQLSAFVDEVMLTLRAVPLEPASSSPEATVAAPSTPPTASATSTPAAATAAPTTSTATSTQLPQPTLPRRAIPRLPAAPLRPLGMGVLRGRVPLLVGLCALAAAFLIGWALHRRASSPAAQLAPTSASATAAQPDPIAADQSASLPPAAADTTSTALSRPPGGPASLAPPQPASSPASPTDSSDQPAPTAVAEPSTASPQPSSAPEVSSAARTGPVPNERATRSTTTATHLVGPTRLPRRNVPGFGMLSSGVMQGNLVSAPLPDYPRLASLAHIEGQVILQAVVAPNGKVVTTHVLSGHRLLRSAAEHAVRRWRYRPYLVNGRPTHIATIVTLDFQLHR